MVYLIVDKCHPILFTLDTFVRNTKKDCNCVYPSLLIIYLKLAKAYKVKFSDCDCTNT
jgi:hypothetical protein